MAESLQSFVDSLLGRAAEGGIRQPLMVVGSADWTLDALEYLVDEVQPETPLLVSNRPIAGIAPAERRQLLGGESDLLILDLWSRPDINTMAAASGCLRGGSLCVMLAPEPVQWSDYYCSAEGSPEYFWQHLLRSIEESPALACLSEREGFTWPDESSVFTAADVSLPTADQLDAMARIRRVLHGHRRRPLVLRADRGRGKSAALGLCSAEFLQENLGDIVLTAPRKDAVSAVFKHAREVLGLEAHNQVCYGESRLLFYAPDQLLREKPAARIVLVDEAAAIPPALLEQMLHCYSRIVFATTVHGYEGSGRGFDVRFGAVLNALAPQWQRFDLQEPIRWSEGDPLEALINRAFLLDADTADFTEVRGHCEVEMLDKLTLFQNESLLREVFGLLVVAHYQTTPADVQQHLHSPASRV